MPQITITLDFEENKQIEILKAREGLKNKAEAIKLVLRQYFKINTKKR